MFTYLAMFVRASATIAKPWKSSTKEKNITEVLGMTVETAVEFFAAVPMIHRRLKTLMDVGLSYICLGQNAHHPFWG